MRVAVSAGRLPVLGEHAGTAHFELAVGETDFDAGQRRADRAGTSLAVQRVRQDHARLGHAVALEQRMPGEPAPPLERAQRQRRRSRHHQAKAPCAVRPRQLLRRGRGVPRGDETMVEGRHGAEHRHVAGREPVPGVGRVELREHLAAGAGGERGAENVDDAVHVVQRQHEQRAIGGRPLPGVDERGDLRRHLPVRRHHSLRLAGRPAGIDDQRSPLQPRPSGRVGARCSILTIRHERSDPRLLPRRGRPGGRESAENAHRPADETAASASAWRPLPTTIDAPESRMTYSSSAGGCETASGTATPPARQMPRETATCAKLGGTRYATRASARSVAPPSSPPPPSRQRRRRSAYGEHPLGGDDGETVGADRLHCATPFDSDR